MVKMAHIKSIRKQKANHKIKEAITEGKQKTLNENKFYKRN